MTTEKVAYTPLVFHHDYDKYQYRRKELISTSNSLACASDSVINVIYSRMPNKASSFVWVGHKSELKPYTQSTNVVGTQKGPATNRIPVINKYSIKKNLNNW